MDKSITQIIQDFQNETSQEGLLPQRASEILVQLSALLGNINTEIRKRDRDYKLVLLENLEKEKTAATAKIRAETSSEYELSKIAKDTKELAVELIRSLKYFLKAFEDEYKHGNNF